MHRENNEEDIVLLNSKHNNPNTNPTQSLMLYSKNSQSKPSVQSVLGTLPPNILAKKTNSFFIEANHEDNVCSTVESNIANAIDVIYDLKNNNNKSNKDNKVVNNNKDKSLDKDEINKVT